MTTSPSSTSTATPAACAAVVRGTRAAHRSPVVRARRAARTPAVVLVPVARRGTRLTRRGRLVLTLVLAGLLLAAFSLGRADAPQAAAEPPAAPAVVQTTVQPGDSLWTVAQRVAPQSDPREVVEQLRRLNDLSGSGLQAGQQLLLPA